MTDAFNYIFFKPFKAVSSKNSSSEISLQINMFASRLQKEIAITSTVLITVVSKLIILPQVGNETCLVKWHTQSLPFLIVVPQDTNTTYLASCLLSSE